MTTSATPVVLCPNAVISSAPAPYVTGAAQSVTVIKRMVINPTNAAVNFTVWRVSFGQGAIVGNQIITARVVGAGKTDLCPELVNMVLAGGDQIQAACSVAGQINLFASGVLTQ